MPLLITSEIWNWVNQHRREKVKTKSYFKYSREQAGMVSGGSGGRRGEPLPEQLALFALLEASVCFSSNVHWFYIGGKPIWASELRIRLGARSRQFAANFPSSCPHVLPFTLWQDLLIRYDKQHSSTRLADFQLTFQKPSWVLPLCEHTLIKPWFSSEHFINPSSAVCQKSQHIEYANECSTQILMPMYLCPQSLLRFTLGCVFYADFLLIFCLALQHAREVAGAPLNWFALPSFADRFDTERGKNLFSHYHIPTGKITNFSTGRAHSKTLDSCKLFL